MLEREALERRANRFDLMSRWSDDLAHEIKNPLHAMVINLELVKRRAGSPDSSHVIERAEIVEAELHRVHALVDSLLRVVRPWPASGSTRVDRVFDDLLPVLGARMRVRRLEYDHRASGGVVAISPGGLAQVVLNLLDNAIDATPAGGRIETLCEDGDPVRITVTDSGHGMPARLRSTAVRAGSSSREGRSGLGLAVSVRLLAEAGGALELEPGPTGGGTRAIVSLPRSGTG